MKKIFPILLLVFLVPVHSFANGISPEKKKLIETLLDQTGQSAVAVGKQFSDLYIQQMIMLLKKAKPDIDPKAFDIVEEEVTALIHEEVVVGKALMNIIYPIYDKHFSESELKQIIEINKTELGKKVIQTMPMITQEGMQAGQQYGQSLGPKIQARIVRRFKEENIE